MHDKTTAATITVLKSFPFCADDARFAGAVEVVEILFDQNRKTIGMRLRVGTRYVRIPRHRTAEVLASLEEAGKEASNSYKQVIREMNP